jgi:hypothetical protein
MAGRGRRGMNTLRDLLQDIRDDRGDLTPAIVVEVARDPEHPLHPHFDWDNDSAAEKYRLHQAGQLLRVTFKPDPTKPTHLRAFVAIKGEDSPQSSYVPTESAMADPFMRALVLRSMNREWKNLKKRYEHMAEFAALIQHDMQGEEAS